MVHGGAGEVPDITAYYPSLQKIITAGEILLQQGVSAFDVVEHCVSLLEDDPQFNAGRGSVLEENGKVEMDAAIMNGEDLKAGSVAGVRNIKNPIQLARKVIEETEHVMLIGEGAMTFAEKVKASKESDEYFLTKKRIQQWKESKKKNRVVLDHSTISKEKYGTVGAVAYDMKGNIAAATSTGGITNKKFGRVGDSPIIGAGVFADNETCAVSATGYGEQFIRTVLSKTIADKIEMLSLSAQEGADSGIAYLVRKVKGLGGVIVIDNQGRCGVAYSTPQMIYAYVQEGETIICGGDTKR